MSARFDDALMEAPALRPTDARLLARVRAWCEAGAFGHALRTLEAAAIEPGLALDGVACALDGSHELARLGRLRGLAWRLQLLLQERLPGRGAQPADPWDCGWWRSGALAAARAFRPRRATLLLVRETDAAQAPALMAALQSNTAVWTRPLRLLVVSATTPPGVARLV